MRKLLWWVVFIAIIVKLAFFIFANKNYFLRPFDFGYFSKLYSESQYVKGELSKGGIGDDGLYAFAGYYYLFQGKDVTTVNFEHPPIGKYLIGVSIFLFKNENVINIIYFVILLFFTYKIAQLVLKNKLLSIMAVFISSTDPLFLDNLIRSLLDLPFTLFITVAVYFFLKGFEDFRQFYLSFLFWGAAFSTKFFPSFIIVYLYLFTYIFLFKRNKLSHFIFSSTIVPILYVLSHVSFFVYHPSFLEFIRHKIWMVVWWSGSPIFVGNIWRNLFTRTYIDSTGKLAISTIWTPVMPVVVFLSITRVRAKFFSKSNQFIVFVYGLCISFLLYLTFFTGGLIKFILPIYPLLVILALSNISAICSIITSCRKRISSKSKGKS